MIETTDRRSVNSSLCWSTGRSKTTARWNSVRGQSWNSFVDWLNPAHPLSTKEVNPYVGGTLINGRRTANTVDHRFLLTLDADYAGPGFLSDVGLLFEGVSYLVHTTWRHTPDAPRYRLVVPLDRGVTGSEYMELSTRVMRLLGEDQFDKTTVQAERFMWGPSTSDPETYNHFIGTGGSYLPVDKWLSGSDNRSEAPQGVPAHNPPPHQTDTPDTSEKSGDRVEDAIRAEEILDDAVQDIIHLHERGKFAGRNEAVFHLLPVLLRFASAGLLDEDLVLDSLFNAAQQVEGDEPYTFEEFSVSVASARKYAEEEGATVPYSTPWRRAVEDFTEIEEDVDLWSLTPQLKHVAQAADNIGCSRASMLAVTLLRVLVQVDPGVQLAGSRDGSVGSRASLNLGVVLLGASGQGKSTVAEASADLLPASEIFRKSKMATGQGLIQAFLRWDEGEQENVLVNQPHALFWFDEIDVLAATHEDSTNTVLGEVRTMMTGGHTGTQTATASRRRNLPARSYNFQLAINAQPSRTKVLLNDREGGTPQRFIWTPVIDRAQVVHPKDRPEWPGVLPWDPSFLLEFDLGIREVVDIPQWLKDELLNYDYEMRLEGMEGGPLSRNSHKNLLRLKVATGIAFLHESPVVLDEHVHIADLVVKDSYKMQQKCEQIISQTEFSAKLARAESDERLAAVSTDKKMESLMAAVTKKLKMRDGWVAWRDLRPAHRDRAVWTDPIQEALRDDPDVEVFDENGEFRKARWVK